MTRRDFAEIRASYYPDVSVADLSTLESVALGVLAGGSLGKWVEFRTARRMGQDLLMRRDEGKDRETQLRNLHRYRLSERLLSLIEDRYRVTRRGGEKGEGMRTAVACGEELS